MKSENLNFLEPSGPLQDCKGMLYLFIICISNYMFRLIYRAIFRLVFGVVCMYNCLCSEIYEASD